MKLDVKNATGGGAGTVDVPDELFGIEPNTAVMHQVVTAQLAAARAAPARARSGRRIGAAVAWRTGRSRATTASARQRR